MTSSLPLRSWMSFWLWRARGLLRWEASFRTQSYDVRYVAEAGNTSNENQEVSLCLPLPRETHYQHVLSAITLKPNPTAVRIENLFQNTYAVWNLRLQPGERQIIEQSFQIRVDPRLKPQSRADNEALDEAMISREHIPSSDSRIQSLAQGFIQQYGTSARMLVEAINRHIIEHVRYGNPISGLYSAKDALERETVDCGGFSTLFVALCQACGIAARIVVGFWTNATKSSMHAWSEAYLPEEGWVAVDPDVEQMRMQNRTRRIGSFGAIGSDRIVYSIGCDIPLLVHNKEYIKDILQTPTIFPPETKIDLSYTFTTSLV